MAVVLAFGVVLLISVSLSGVAARTILSTALLFLLAGALLGQGVLGWVEIAPSSPVVTVLVDIALFTVLFTDGGRADLRALREGWRLSGRAVGLGLAAFAAGAPLATLDHVAAARFGPLGDLLSEVTKFAALLVFGALITPERLSHLSVGDWAVAVLAILLVRPSAMPLSLLRTPLPARERSAAAWFGPKGFASVVYGLLALQAGIPAGEHVFDLVAITIALSIVLHSSTDVPVARTLRIEPPDTLPTGHTGSSAPAELAR